MEAVFADDLRHSEPVTYEKWKKRGLKARLFETLVAPLRTLL
jgi:hypothetical protein